MQGLSLTLVNFATTGSATPRLLQAAAAAAASQLDCFSTAQLGRIAWAFSTLDFHPGSLLMAGIARRLQQETPSFDDKSAAQALWSLARYTSSPQSCHPQTIVNTTAALGNTKAMVGVRVQVCSNGH